MEAFVEAHEEYHDMDEDTATAISAVIGTENFMKNKEKFKNREGYNMCTAIREMKEEGRNEGIALSVEIYHAVNSGITDNEAIAARCGCTAAQVKRVREAFEQKR